MGRFLNPDNGTFQTARNSKVYVDKTELLDLTNQVIHTKQAFICNSRPRRFGKSITADMLSAYYSKGCDSKQIFADLKIGRMESFQEHLNQYDVIHIDMQWCMQDAGGAKQIVEYINTHIVNELSEVYPQVNLETVATAYGAMSLIHAETGSIFIVIIDEWDVLIRDDANNRAIQDEYIDFLRGMFKGTEPTKFIGLAYLTGILPIKKMKTQSALNNFDEYTMLGAGQFSPYVGFTEEEVKELCVCYDRDFEKVKRWYDGYRLGEWHIYNPKAVVSVMLRGEFQSYWSQTGTYEVVVPLINMDFDGLRAAIIEMIAGSLVPLEVGTFQNDTVSFADRDDVLTYLIHLGYLAYDQQRHCAFIPNEEVRQELIAATKRKKWTELDAFEQESRKLLDATLDLDADAVAEEIKKIHTEYASTIQYNDENSLSSVLAIGYLSSLQYYLKPIRELPTGRGFADFVYLPKPEYAFDYPAFLVELKWNKNAKTALQQIKDKKYPDSLLQYTGNLLLVGINYDKKTKVHQCLIEECEK